MLGLITWFDEIMPTVEPSLGAFTTCTVPVMPPAPARLSITIECPMTLPIWLLMARATASTVEPADRGTTTRMGLSDWASTCAAGNASPRQARTSTPWRAMG
jgi:hypothetical protein